MYCRKSSEAEDRQVQSIADQTAELNKVVNSRKLNVVKFFSESKSAKAPNRLEFDKMIHFIEDKGDIHGIVAWKINRLTRNPIDTGTLQWLLQNGTIKKIVTPSKTYTETDSDFMMAVEGAQASRFIRDLREDTRRGIESKLKKGHFPGLAPPGYINNKNKKKGEKDISPHPVYFPLMRKLLELAMTGNYSVARLCIKANGMGLRNSRGSKVCKTQLNKQLKNPFYIKKFIYAGKEYQGSHKRMLTDQEFQLIQEIISGRSRPRKIRHDFLSGLMKCGECEMAVVGETHVKVYKNGTKQRFTYYRCSKHHKTKKCSQPFIRAEELEQQFVNFLETITVSQNFVDWAIDIINKMGQKQNKLIKAEQRAQEIICENVNKRIENLFNLKISPDNSDGSILSDYEYAEKKKGLSKERDQAYEKLEDIGKNSEKWRDLAVGVFNFAAIAAEKFQNGDMDTKKSIMRTVGSYLKIKDKQLEVTPQGPFEVIRKAIKTYKIRFEPADFAHAVQNSDNLSSQNLYWGG